LRRAARRSAAGAARLANVTASPGGNPLAAAAALDYVAEQADNRSDAGVGGVSVR